MWTAPLKLETVLHSLRRERCQPPTKYIYYNSTMRRCFPHLTSFFSEEEGKQIHNSILNRLSTRTIAK